MYSRNASSMPGSMGGGSYSASNCFQMPFARSAAESAPASCHVSKLRPVRHDRRVEDVLVARQGVRRAEEVAARLHLGDGVDGQGVVIDHHRLQVLGEELAHLGVDHTSFSYEAVSPPSSHPAAWLTMLVCAITEAHSDISLSYAAWASTAFDALVLLARKGTW